ncbi:MAG: S8 family peptidase [Candidatus Omnitrophica bacterium]|nr:S8 family peptidase [Candidatus Omnitrophota bacterium]
MPEGNLPHIFLSHLAQAISYTPPPGGNGQKRLPHRNRSQHGERLQRELDAAWNEARRIQESRGAVSLPARDGTYLEFRSQSGHDLVFKSLEDLKQKIRLLNVRKEGADENEVTIATVYVPSGKISHFLNKIRKYAENEKNKDLVDGIEDIRLAVLESFWQDNTNLIPRQNRQWCEVWLRTIKEEEQDIETAFRGLCADMGIECQEGSLHFPERLVLMVKANDSELTELMESHDNIAEFRLSKETAGFWVELPNQEQAEWVQDLLGRTQMNDSNVSVCVLDTGANNGHPLLSNALTDENCLTFDPTWGENDHHPHGHGTSMCGVALYGDIQNVLISMEPVIINHHLESVKILPPEGQNPRELWGHVTSQAVSQAEISNPDNLRINCMAITSEDDRDHGRPSSWSAALDSLAAGFEEDIKRLFIVSAGNVRDHDEWLSYPESNQTNSVHDPGQAWNALTVGAMTTKNSINNPDYSGYLPIAPYGGLSPFSTTSLIWDQKKWPIKPEILLEGGNAGRDGDFISEIDDLSILSTHHNFTSRQFSVFNATSAATAEASRMAAIIQAAYPQAWPETIRALMIHSAHWTDELKQQFGITDNSNKTAYAALMRICGYGVPDLDRALHCAGNTVTLIAQETIQPYAKKEESPGYRTKDMHIYELPWPQDILLNLGDLPIQLRITLSYFIEPGPGEIGWKDRYRYPSYGFRFDLNSPNETRQEFLSRLNAAAREEDEGRSSNSGSDRWTIGQTRNLGSIHSDIWNGTAADIATCNLIGIFPIIGWWRERAYLNRWDKEARYSLIVSLHTPEEEIDIYTPISNAIMPDIPIEIEH